MSLDDIKAIHDIQAIPSLPLPTGSDEALPDTKPVTVEGTTELSLESFNRVMRDHRILMEEHRILKEDYRALKEVDRVREDRYDRLHDEVMALKAGFETQRQFILPRQSQDPSLPRLTATPTSSTEEFPITDLLRSSRLRSVSPMLPLTPIKTETTT